MDKFTTDLVKIWRKSVDWFKRYSKNQCKTLTYFLKIGQKGFNGLILYQFGENLA